MRHSTHLALLLALGAAAASTAAEAPAAPPSPPEDTEIQLYSIQERSGRLETFAISRARAGRLPVWRAGSEPPPLPVERAVALGLDWARRRHPGAEVALESVQMSPIGLDAAVSSWSYMLGISAIREGSPIEATLRVVVLMDGTVVPARVGRGTYPDHRW